MQEIIERIEKEIKEKRAKLEKKLQEYNDYSVLAVECDQEMRNLEVDLEKLTTSLQSLTLNKEQ